MDISASGEFTLISRLTSGLSSRSDVNLGVGDDCAILDPGGDTLLLATCDSQVEGIHFTLRTSTPAQIGRKALAINLSDIAAMGGEPRYALVSLILPAKIPIAILDGVYAGLREEGERFATAIVGGNVAGAGGGEQLIIDITLLGSVERGRAIRRDGARPGDILCVTGSLGDSAAGLHTLLHPSETYPQDAQAIVQAIHRTPRPRVLEGRVFSRLGPQVITGMLDISDGLSGDLTHLCERSHVGAWLDLARLPLSPALHAVAASAGHDPLQWALHGGEDYELLFTVAPDQVEAVRAAMKEEIGTPVTVIGEMMPAEMGIRARSSDGRVVSLEVASWDHLRPE
jgi:thiamine-monophosphate kinase